MKLFWLNFKVGLYNLIENLKVFFLYYQNLTFAKLDFDLLRGYLLKGPFRFSKEFLTKKGELEVYAYGETPLTTLDSITKRCKINASDVIYELGCGRGRTCFWLHSFVGCHVVGVEFVPYFVEQANRVVQSHHLENIEFLCEDMLEVDLSDATVIYFYGTCSEEAFIKSLIKKLPKGVKVITVSYSLNDYGASFEVVDQFEASFPWGMGKVYVHTT